MNDIEALNADILSETRKLADEYAVKFKGDPDGELRAWLHIAARREAMVSNVYAEADRIQRLPEPRAPAGDVAWEALTLIWQQEAVHTKFIEVRLSDGLLRDRPLSADVMIWLGAMEGTFLTALTGRAGLRQILSKLAIQLGALFAPGTVPEFAHGLAEMDLREFFLLCAALEATARQCYARMEALAATLAERRARDVPSPQLHNLAHELRLKTLDEAFHEAAFQEMAGWVVDGHINPALAAPACAQRLFKLLPPAETIRRDLHVTQVRTDGGLRKLFLKHGLSFAIE
jgi:hypothetical protein